MRLTSTQLRVGALCVNLGLGLGVPGYAAYRYWSLVEDPASAKPRVALVDKALFVYSERDSRAPASNGLNELRFVGTIFQPAPPPPPPTDTGPTTTKQADPGEEASDPDDLKPGKLHEAGWYYYAYFLREDEPEKNWVILRKRDPQTANPPGVNTPPAPGSSRSTARPVVNRTAPGRPAPRPGARGKGLPQPPGDQISFAVELRRFTDKERDLDFMIHSADKTQLIYWEYGKPEVKYALKYEPQGEYRKKASELHVSLNPAEAPPEEPGAPQKKTYFIHVDKDLEAARREEYQMLESGKGHEPADKPTRGGLRDVKPEDDGGASSPDIPSPAPKQGQAGAAARKASAPQPKDLKEALGSKEMKDALKAMPAKDKKEFLDALKGVKSAR